MINDKSSLVRVMAWYKPLPETMMIQFTDAYMPDLNDITMTL